MADQSSITIARLAEMKRAKTPIAMLTAYDASMAAVFDDAGIDCILVGDSLGNVIQGCDSTVPVTVDHMIYHVECVRRGTRRAMLIGDMPFLSYSSEAVAIETDVDEPFGRQGDGLAVEDLVGPEKPVLTAEANGPDVDGEDVEDGFAALGEHDLDRGGTVGEEGRVEDVEESVHAAIAGVHARVEFVKKAHGAAFGGAGGRFADLDVVTGLAEAFPGPDGVGDVGDGVAQKAVDLEHAEGRVVRQGDEFARDALEGALIFGEGDGEHGVAAFAGGEGFGAGRGFGRAAKSLEPVEHVGAILVLVSSTW